MESDDECITKPCTIAITLENIIFQYFVLSPFLVQISSNLLGILNIVLSM